MSYREFAILGEIAENQGGLVSTAQAVRAGVARAALARMASAGAAHRIVRGVYRLAGAPETPHERVLATIISLGGFDDPDSRLPRIVAAGETAADIHEIGDYLPFKMHLMTRHRQTTHNQFVNLSLAPFDLTVDDFTYVNDVPVLTVERTIVDLLTRAGDLSLVGDALADAKRAQKIRPDVLRRLLKPLDITRTQAGGNVDELIAILATHNAAAAA